MVEVGRNTNGKDKGFHHGLHRLKTKKTKIKINRPLRSINLSFAQSSENQINTDKDKDKYLPQRHRNTEKKKRF